jgi:hypothetical protein
MDIALSRLGSIGLAIVRALRQDVNHGMASRSPVGGPMIWAAIFIAWLAVSYAVARIIGRCSST